MMAQSAFRCSWTDFSNGASGSTDGFDVEGVLVDLVSPFFSGCLVEAPVGARGEVEAEAEVVLFGWRGFFGDSPRELVDENARIFEVVEACGSSWLRNWY